MRTEIRNPNHSAFVAPASLFYLCEFILLALTIGLAGVGCKKSPPPASPARSQAAKSLFDKATKEFHNPSAEKTGAEREKLLNQAALSYEQVLRDFSEQTNWCAQAMRSLGSVRAAQGRMPEAIKLFRDVAQKYPNQEWEIIQAWKAAGDLLHAAGQADEARQFYRQIIQRFDKPDMPQVVSIIVKGAKQNLAK